MASKEKFPRFHDKGSYNKFHHILNEPPEDQSLQQQLEVSEYLVSLYSQYVNSKGRRLDQVRNSGIDKKSDSYIPHLKNTGYYGASYCIKILNNTFINQIYGTVGFTVAEYFGHVRLEEKETDTEKAILPVIGVQNNS